MSISSVALLALVVALIGYLVVALIRPDKF